MKKFEKKLHKVHSSMKKYKLSIKKYTFILHNILYTIIIRHYV
jgi:hypothetical protein